jgi:hypothetical protein
MALVQVAATGALILLSVLVMGVGPSSSTPVPPWTDLGSTSSVGGTVPASCGVVGTPGYVAPPVPSPTIVVDRGEIITVNTSDDVINGNTANVSDLLKDPGPEGLSLPEAILAADNSSGAYTIDFAANLSGAEIDIGSPLNLTAGNLTINGSIGRTTVPAITINDTAYPSAIEVQSSDNTVYGLKIIGSKLDGVLLTPPSGRSASYVNDTVADLVVDGGFSTGIGLTTWSVGGGPTPTGERWVDTLLVNNQVNVSSSMGIGLFVDNSGSNGSYIAGTTIVNNTIITAGSPTSFDRGIDVGSDYSNGSDNNSILNTVIAGNTLHSGGYVNSFGIEAIIGDGGSHDVFEGTSIIDNEVFPSLPGNGSAIQFGIQEGAPSVYAHNSTFANALVAGNLVDGPDWFGIDAARTSSVNSTEKNVTIEGNTIDLPSNSEGVTGIRLVAGSIPSNLIRDNTLSGILVKWNSISVGSPEPNTFASAVSLIGGQFGATDNLLAQTVIANNLLEPTDELGVEAWGGFQGSSDNTVTGLNLTCNDVTGGPNGDIGPDEPASGILLGGGAGFASGNGPTTGNVVSNVLICNNSVAGVLDNISTYENIGSDASGNTVSVQLCSPPSPPRFSVSFAESGLPADTNWSVTINGITQNTSSTPIVFEEVDATYAYAIGVVAGYTSNVTSGYVTVAGSARTVSVDFTPVPPAAKFSVSFTEMGLPIGTNWSVTLNGSTQSATATRIVFEEIDATYSYTVGTVDGYTSNVTTGYVTVAGAPRTVSVSFTPTHEGANGGASPSGGLNTTDWEIIGAAMAVAAVGGILVTWRRRTRGTSVPPSSPKVAPPSPPHP